MSDPVMSDWAKRFVMLRNAREEIEKLLGENKATGKLEFPRDERDLVRGVVYSLSVSMSCLDCLSTLLTIVEQFKAPKSKADA